jgi:hypothetical protein
MRSTKTVLPDKKFSGEEEWRDIAFLSVRAEISIRKDL